MKKIIENIKEIMAMIITLIVAIVKDDNSTAHLMGEALGIMTVDAVMNVIAAVKKIARYIRKNVVDIVAMLISFTLLTVLVVVCNAYITEPLDGSDTVVIVEMKYQHPLHQMVTITDEDSTITVELVKWMESLVTINEEVVELTREEIKLMEAIHIPSIEELKWMESLELVDVSELVHITFDKLPWVDTMEEKRDMIELLLVNGLKVLLYKGEFYVLSEEQFVTGREATDLLCIWHYEYADRDNLKYYSGIMSEHKYSNYGDYVVYLSYND